jgi:MobA/MobL family
MEAHPAADCEAIVAMIFFPPEVARLPKRLYRCHNVGLAGRLPMAIFSLHHSFIGRSTHPPGAAGTWGRYITRNDACTVIQGERMPLDRSVYAWLDEQEKSDRKNARVIDRVVVALPVELSREQNIELLQSFGERMTEGRTPWMAAIHDGPGDADNPHAHLILRDRDVESGRRVMMTTEAGSTERIRQVWEEEVNRALERAGFEVRVDRRSLAEQRIDREPQLHVGAGAQRFADREYEFRSSEKQVTRIIDGTPTEVTVN